MFSGNEIDVFYHFTFTVNFSLYTKKYTSEHFALSENSTCVHNIKCKITRYIEIHDQHDKHFDTIYFHKQLGVYVSFNDKEPKIDVIKSQT